jgi:hypothetical protein
MDEQRESKASLVLGRTWQRSDGYVLEDGMLRLKPGAALESYDPWEAWRSSPDEQRPYKSLLRLAQKLEIGGTRFEPRLAAHQQQLLEQWVRRNGLLGILPHETLEVTQAPRWVDERELASDSGTDPSGVSVLVPVQRRSERTALGWQRSFPRPAYAREVDPESAGKLVSEERLGAAWLPVEALYRRLPEGRLERRPLSEHWHAFFVEVPRNERETHAYPDIGSDQFWPSYGEPLGSFVETARSLAEAVRALEQLQRGAELDDEQEMIAWRAIRRINAYAAAVSPVGLPASEGVLRVAWSSPSLLGCFAVMLLSDLAAGQLIRSCPNCGVFFLSGNRKAIYCSSSCRYAYQKRQWRAGRAEQTDERA